MLRSVDYRDSDRILTLFTRDHGKVSAVAKGARSSRKRFGGALEPFAVTEVVLTSGRGSAGLLVITEARALEVHSGLSTSLGRLGGAALLTELLRELSPEHETDPAAFDLLAGCFQLLGGKAGDPGVISLWGQLRLLRGAGLGLCLSRCNSCGVAVPSGKKVLVDLRRGGVVCTPCGGGPILLGGRAGGLLIALETIEAEQLSEVEAKAEDIREAQDLLHRFIEFQLDRPLKSGRFF